MSQCITRRVQLRPQHGGKPPDHLADLACFERAVAKDERAGAALFAGPSAALAWLDAGALALLTIAG